MAEEELQEEQQLEKKSGNAADTIKLIIAGIVVIIIAAGISFAVAKMAASSAPPPPTYNANAKIKTETIGTTFDAGEYITNLSGGSSYIKLRVVFAFTNPDVELEINNKLPVVQHTINKVLREQTVENLSEPKGMEKLSETLKKSINELLVKGNVDSVYFTNFVVQ